MLGQLSQAIQRQKSILLLVVILFLVLGLVVTLTGGRERQTTLTLLLRFDNVNRGYYPDGSPFNKEDLIAPAVLQKVVGALDLREAGVSAHTLRRHLDVEGIMSAETIRQTERLQQEGRPPEGIFPSEYRLSLLEGERLGLAQERQEEILLAVVDAYTDRFRRVHAGLDSPLPSLLIDTADLQAYDYPLIPDLLSARVDQVLDFLETLKARSGTFRSAELGFSFSDVKWELEAVQEEGIGQLSALIQENRLTADPEGLRRRYLEKIEDLETEIFRKEQEAGFARELLRDLEIELPQEPLAEGLADIVEVLLKHEYHTTLLTRSLEAGLEVEKMKVEQAYYLAELERLTGSPAAGDEAETVAAGPANPSPEIAAQVDREIEQTVQRIQDYLELLDAMRQEALEEEAARAVHVLRPPQGEIAGRPAAQLLAGWLFLGLLAGGTLAYYRETKHNRDQPGDREAQPAPPDSNEQAEDE